RFGRRTVRQGWRLVMSGRRRGGRRAWRVLMLACIPLTAAGADRPAPPAPPGSALLVLNGGFASNAAAPTDRYGRHWTQVGPTAVYDGYQGRFDVKAYVSLAGPGGRHHTVSIDKPGEPEREITIPFVEIRHAGVLQDFAQN